jgi:hypothetical protein
MGKLTQAQLESWRRTRAKGRTRIVVEQFLYAEASAAHPTPGQGGIGRST